MNKLAQQSSIAINIKGWLNGVERIESPHYDERPVNHDEKRERLDPVNLLVLHNISLPPNQFGDKYVKALFTGNIGKHQHVHPFLAEIANLRVSAHFYISRDGHIIQFVATTNRAWHAGVSYYEGREHCNDFSIGIELNGSDHTPYTYQQYRSLNTLCRAIMQRHPHITTSRITTHSHIAPNRKTDPGPAFNLNFLQSLLRIN